jgi:hypothetical protein
MINVDHFKFCQQLTTPVSVIIVATWHNLNICIGVPVANPNPFVQSLIHMERYLKTWAIYVST